MFALLAVVVECVCVREFSECVTNEELKVCERRTRQTLCASVAKWKGGGLRVRFSKFFPGAKTTYKPRAPTVNRVSEKQCVRFQCVRLPFLPCRPLPSRISG